MFHNILYKNIKAACLVFSAVSVISSCQPAFAMSSTAFQNRYSIATTGYTLAKQDLVVPVAKEESKNECYDEVRSIVAKEYPVVMAANPYICLAYYNINSQMDKSEYIGAVYKADLDELDKNETYMKQWVAVNIPKIVPDGTPAAKIPMIAAKYTASVLSYDFDYFNNYKDSDDFSYSFPMKGLTTGKGTCTTYTALFNTIVRFSMIDPKTKTVNYKCKNPEYIPVNSAGNSTHCWSAIYMNNAWHHYDVTNYDTNKNKMYLDMNAKTLASDFYKGWKLD